ncbi:sugar porter family MFS transporter [Bifidobacterium sp. ESL0732]|uniref:sugar porter family MFS transporter n=1 Tax=Bifidobacterium sp. ESL0732 TaxID=2983222 RepID=UPI0023F94805|nr:sugar porter family MFS transporter [Bifidobacterium sp. ESL0732]WEV64054.1 sugar porter family MFS transporter [Bifidobacterium sp. ESL0732]
MLSEQIRWPSAADSVSSVDSAGSVDSIDSAGSARPAGVTQPVEVAGSADSVELPSVVSPPSSHRHYMAVLVALGICGGGLYGYTLTFLSGALVSMNFDGSNRPLSAWDQSVLTAVMLLGSAIGSYVGGELADRFGRKRLIIAGGITAVVGALLCALATSFGGFLAGRFIVGFAIGITECVIPIYLGEMAPANRRGFIVSVNSVMINVAQLAASLVNAVLVSVADWHAMVWAAVVPTVLLTVVALVIKEAPTFSGRQSDVSNKRDVTTVSSPKQDSSSQADSDTNVVLEQATSPRSANQANRSAAKAPTFRAPWLRRVLFVGIGVAMINQLIGCNAINYFAPTMFSSTLGIDPHNSVVAMVPVMAASAVAAIIGGLIFIDRINRRTFLIVGLCGSSFFLAAVGLCYLFIDSKHPNPALSWVLIGLVMCYLAFAQGMVSPVTWLLITEIFPSFVRGKGVGYANVVINITNFVISLVFLPLLNTVGSAGTFFIFALINVGSACFSKVYVPETRGKTLDQIEHEARARVSA